MNRDGVTLGNGVILTGENLEMQPNANQAVVGASGSGKTVSVLLPSMLGMEKENFIATFSKGREARKLARYMAKKGYKMHLLDLSDPEKSNCRFDPLDYLDSFMDIEEFSSAVVLANPQYSDPRHVYWNDSASNLMSAMVEAVMRKGGRFTIAQVVDLFNSLKIVEDGKAIQSSLDDYFEEIKKKVPDSPAAAYFRDYLQLPYATAGCVRDSLAKALRKMFPKDLCDFLRDGSGKPIDFEDFTSRKSGLIIITSPVNRSLHLYANMVMNMAIKELMEIAEKRDESNPPIRTKLFFDDFAAGCQMVDFDRKISIFREAGLSVMMLLQSESQLVDVYGHAGAGTILNNCSSYVYFTGGNDLLTCRQVAEKIDANLQSILFAPVGKVVIMRAGAKPVITDRYDTYNSGEYREYAAFLDKESRKEKRGELLWK